MVDAVANFAYTTVATAPSPATSGTSLVVATGTGALFPAVPFNAIVCPTGVQPLVSNAEIVRVTAISTDTLTIIRAVEGSTARSIVATDQIFQGVTAATVADLAAGFKIRAEQTSAPATTGWAVGDIWMDTVAATPVMRLWDGSVFNPPATASGGVITHSSGYEIHTFTSSGTFMVGNAGVQIEYLLVAGGGSGGPGGPGGGGGAGGLLTNVGGTLLTPGLGSFPIVIGAGGAGTTNATNNSGGNSTAFGLTAVGGGRGSWYNSSSSTGNVPAVGGSGGGQASNWWGTSPVAGTAGQGNAGGYLFGKGGGGGGAGAAAVTSTGGAGLSNSITTAAVTYAGGGGGGGYDANGGSGGGGTGTSGTLAAGSGTNGLGGGGGGSYRNTDLSGSGGSGVVIIRFLPPAAPGNQVDGGTAFSVYGGSTVINGGGA